MSVLIIGGAGYIGSHISKLFIEKEIPIIILDNLINGHLESIDKNALFYNGDYGDKHLLQLIFKKHNINTIIHLGGYISVSDSVKHPLKYYYNNYYKTLVLLHQAKKYNTKNIIFASSAAVYGKNNFLRPLRETSSIKPSNAYGRSKILCEKAIKKSGINYCNLRFFNVSGSDRNIGESHKNEFHIIPTIINKFFNKQIFYINGQSFNTNDGTCIRDYIHVKDVCNLIYKAYIYLQKKKRR